MSSINNVEKLKNLLEFKSNTYYKFVALVRAKDYGDEESVLTNFTGQEIMIKQWLVDSQSKLDAVLPDMLTLVELLKCRLYLITDRKNIKKTLLNLRNLSNKFLDNYLLSDNYFLTAHGLSRISNSVSNLKESSDRDKRMWMFDVDTKDEEILNTVKNMCGEFYIDTLETKNGYHVLAWKKFNAKELINDYANQYVELKDNAMTLVAMY